MGTPSPRTAAVAGAGRLWVLTGAPGTGKTAVLEALPDVVRMPEPARLVLAEQRRIGGTATGDQDAAAFVALLLQRAIEQYEGAGGIDGTIVFDRGIPDCIAYAAAYRLDTRPAVDAAERHRYNPTVLVLRPWRDIFTNDDERTLTFEMAVRFQELVESAYRNAGYDLVEVPPGTIAERAAFVRAAIAATLNSEPRG